MAAQQRASLALLLDFFLFCGKITEQAIIRLVESYPQISRVKLEYYEIKRVCAKGRQSFME